jgi:2-phosphosulfolactate phosphatase
MRIDLHLTPHQTDEFALRDRTVVVVDVLRASTTIVAALHNGAREIIPVTSVERAVKISGSLFGDAILRGGERNGRMIEGFNLGNSPAEYTEEKVRGKAIIFSTTNGSLAIERARYARLMLVCGFVNMAAVADALTRGAADFTVLCAGNNGLFSLEDTVCAGMLIRAVTELRETGAELSDGAVAAVTLHKALGRNILKMIRGSDHGRFLAEIGFAEDLPLCAAVDQIPVVPHLAGNVIKLRADGERREAVPVTAA